MEYQIPLYPRNIYLDKITPFREDCGRIKVLTGVRRCGKSSIMELVRRQLLTEGVPEQNLMFLNLDSKENNGKKTKTKLRKKIDLLSRKAKEGIKYLFVDEIQNVKDFETVINAYREEGGYSIFITGSNGYLLSGKLATKLTGRYIEFYIGTLLFSEYIGRKKFLGKKVNPNLDAEFQEYILDGGFPKSLEYDSPEAKKNYVKSLIDEIYQKDIYANKSIRNPSAFEQIKNYVINNFGATFSARSLAKNLSQATKTNHSRRTIYNYLSILENAKILSKCTRFDRKSKKSLLGEEKFYLSDLSFYFATNTDTRINYGPVLENLVYNYAKVLGYDISIGRIGKLEIDFIRNKPRNNFSYVQVARTLDNGSYNKDGIPQTEEREYRPLETIPDNYPKYILTMDHLLQQRNGIINLNLIDFFLDQKRF